MIITSYARTGSTKFGLDLAEKHNLRFMGEITGSHLISTGTKSHKHEIHETKFQPMLSDQEYYNAIYNNKDLVILVNRGGYLLLDKADYVVLRNDPLGCCLSFADLIMRPTSGRDSLHWRSVLFYTRLMFDDMLSLVTCAVEYPTDLPLVWFFTEFIEASDVQHKLDILKERQIIKSPHPGKDFAKYWSFTY